MNALKARKVAARLLKCGESKVWIDPAQATRVKEAITKEDVRAMIAERIIKKRRDEGKTNPVGAGRKKRGKTGPGKKRGTAKARSQERKKWIKNVRAQRKKLAELRGKKVKFRVPYRKVYRMVKGGFFKGKKYVEAFVAGEKK
ncbi:MAG: 50S ribosomal protein L19e [Candidatus Diapherotrites archaeon]|nr:50S ribosomal protein L19e [Candidatus Diapherotrites archaeon]